jgi:ABC-type dipeptide/oligopeptide/nickel transport system permease subunit
MPDLRLPAALLLASLGLSTQLGWVGQDWALVLHAPLQAPGTELLLGSNALGQNLGHRWLQALAGLWTTALPAMLLALLLALLLAWWAAGRGPLRVLAHTLIDLADAVPALLLLLALGFVLRGWAFGAVLVLALCLWPESVRLLEIRLRSLRQSDWWLQAQLSGAGVLRMIFVQLPTNLLPVLRDQAVLLFVLAVKTEVLLSFLGLRHSESVSLGGLLSEGLQASAQGVWFPLLLPCCTLVLIVASALLLGGHGQQRGAQTNLRML